MKFADHKGVVHRGEYNASLRMWGAYCRHDLRDMMSPTVAQRMGVRDAVEVNCRPCLQRGNGGRAVLEDGLIHGVEWYFNAAKHVVSCTRRELGPWENIDLRTTDPRSTSCIACIAMGL